MDQQEKAEIVLASFRSERECRGCHFFITKEEAVVWSEPNTMCWNCWYGIDRSIQATRAGARQWYRE